MWIAALAGPPFAALPEAFWPPTPRPLPEPAPGAPFRSNPPPLIHISSRKTTKDACWTGKNETKTETVSLVSRWGICLMSRGGEFKGDSPDKGGRLGLGRGSGLTAIERRYVESEDIDEKVGIIRASLRVKRHIASGRPIRNLGELMALTEIPEPRGKGPAAGLRPPEGGLVLRRSGPKGGRPKVEGMRPWEAAGVSKATWFRRKKGVGDEA
jgi:hypothetical protein